ncbi:hypothetical protein LHP98_13085 [Rhodobacter sp. Har01]|uniref:hypothetical protein n=1 Tax=Rhodobacter sp. Har01 TaxID=2883999 RepID=UPI001D0926A9|nr:hypothetical protein [Rhodobacter sp. Har01]MCB6179055.1 hypothetical protein [Rhodobacter sp. Har01]
MVDFTKPFAGVSKAPSEMPLFTILLEPKDVLSRDQNSLLRLTASGSLEHILIDVHDNGAFRSLGKTFQLTSSWTFEGQPAFLYSPDYELLSAFTIGTGGYVYQNFQARETDTDAFPPWSGWTGLPQSVKFQGGVAALNAPDGKKAYVFALGQDNYIHQNTYQRGAGGGWLGWQKLPGAQKFDSAPTAINSPDGTLTSVFATGQDQAIYQTFTSHASGGSWQGWSKLPDTRKFASAPAAMNSADGLHASVFALGHDGFIYQCIYDRVPGGSWGSWQKLPGTIKFASAPSVSNSPDGMKVTVLALDSGKRLHQIVYCRKPGEGWGTWAAILGTQQFESVPPIVPAVLHRKSQNALLGLLFGTGNTTVAGYYKENSYGNFTLKNGFTTRWMTASDDPLTSGVDESSYEHIHMGGEIAEQEKGKWLLREIENQNVIRLSQFARNGKIERKDLAFLWLYSGGALGSGRQRDLPAVTSGLSTEVHAEVLARGEHHCAPTLIAHELGHSIFRLHDLYSGLWMVSMAMGGPNDHVYCWTQNAEGEGAVYEGGPVFLARNGRKTFHPPADVRLDKDQIVAMAMAGTDDHVYTWYADDSGDGYVCGGTTTHLDSYRKKRRFALPTGKTPANIVDIGITAQDLVVAWYDDRTFSTGTTEDLASRPLNPGAQTQPYVLPGSKIPADILSIEIRKSTNQVYTWYRDGTFSVGHFHDLAFVDYPAPYKVPPEAYPSPGTLSLMSYNVSAFIPHLDPWSKMKLGWLKPQIITSSGTHTLKNIEKNSDGACILYDPARGEQEYFIVENRWPAGSSEAGLGAQGIAIWHIHERSQDGVGTNHVGRKTVQLVKPDGVQIGGYRSLDTSVGGGLWHAGSPAHSYDVTSTSVPANTLWDDGKPSGIEIRDFSAAGPTMTVYFKVP